MKQWNRLFASSSIAANMPANENVNQDANVKRFRFAQHDSCNDEQFRFNTGLDANVYVKSGQPLKLDGWIAGCSSPVTALRISVVQSRRRELALVESFNESPAIKKQFPALKKAAMAGFCVDLTSLPELRKRSDFALELIAQIDNNWLPVTTLTFVRDEHRNPSVFIVGSPRSGTTIVGDSIRKTLSSGSGFGESHVLPLASLITKTVTEYHSDNGASNLSGMMLNHINPSLMGEQMLSVLKQQYTSLFEEEWIIDKTPGGPMIRVLPDIQRLWPDARIIFVKRRGIENVVSRIQKFPHIDFESHCKQWKNCMNAWTRVKSSLNYSLEIDQYDVLTQPAKTAAKISEFLGLSELQQTQLAGHFTSDRPEQTGKSVLPAALDFKTLDWSEERKSIFHHHCAGNLKKWGYSTDGNYYARVSV